MNTAAFDREAEYFTEYFVPQIQIKLNLVCGSESSMILTHQNITMFSENILTDEILYSRTVTHLNIIIVDQNDNSPVFTNPATSGVYVGQPDAELSEKLMPRHLIAIQAHDIDEGINAKIQFSLGSYDHFTIEPETGIIYPTKTSMMNEDMVTVVVKATDKDGAADGRVSTTSLVVRKVKTENVIVLVVEDQALESVDEIIKEVADSVEIDLRIINSFALPSSLERKQSDANTKIIIYAYAFAQSNDLLMSQEVTDALTNTSVSAIFTLSPYDGGCILADCSHAGYIIAIVLLGLLIVAMGLSVPFIWIFWLRYKIKGNSRKNSASSFNKFEQNFSEETMGQSSPVAIESSPESRRSDANIVGIDIEGATEGK